MNKKIITTLQSVIPFKNLNIIWICILIIVTFFLYFPGLNNEFVNWDDNVYVTGNKLIQNISKENITIIFSQSFEGHYHPLTLLSFAADYYFFKNEAFFYHLINILLHLINTLLVFIIIRKLFNYTEIAVITALLFGIHPMHVESVAWITARKDVLFSVFFLLSLLTYINYLKNQKTGFYLLSLVLFILSVLSKSQAVSLSVTLLAIDYLQKRRLSSKRVFTEKLPYLVIAIFFGIVTIYAQKETGYSGQDTSLPPFYERIAYACYGFNAYIIKLIAPFNLSAYYPYPVNDSGNIPYYVHLSVIPVLVFLWLLFYFRKHREVVFAMIFFLINIVLMLKLFPVANFIIADRYTYIPSIGLFIIIGILFRKTSNLLRLWRRTFQLIFVIYFAFMGFLTFQRVEIWQNSMTLLDDILEKHPGVVTALNSRGDVKAETGDLKGALSDFTRAITQDPLSSRSYRNRALVKYRLNDFKGSVVDYNTAIRISPDDAISYFNRGLAKEGLNDMKGAYADYSQSIKIDPLFARAYANRARLSNMSGFFEEAVADISIALELGLVHHELYFEKGFALYNLRDFKAAINAFDKSLELNENFADAYLYRGYAKNNLGDYKGSIADLDIALKSDPSNAVAYGIRGLAKINSGNKESGCRDLKAAEKLGLTQAKSEIEKYCKD